MIVIKQFEHSAAAIRVSMDPVRDELYQVVFWDISFAVFRGPKIEL